MILILKQEMLVSIVSRDSVTRGFCCVCVYVLVVVVVVGGGGGPYTCQIFLDLTSPLYRGGRSTCIHIHYRFLLGSEFRSTQICLDLIFPLYGVGGGGPHNTYTCQIFWESEFRSTQICLIFPEFTSTQICLIIPLLKYV